jgi:hypothetical protein
MMAMADIDLSEESGASTFKEEMCENILRHIKS